MTVGNAYFRIICDANSAFNNNALQTNHYTFLSVYSYVIKILIICVCGVEYCEHYICVRFHLLIDENIRGLNFTVMKYFTNVLSIQSWVKGIWIIAAE